MINFQKIKNYSIKNWPNIILYLFIVTLTVVIFAQKAEFSSLDLGRHIKNGEVVWSNPSVLYTNFYSFTEQHLPFVNHHWLAGVLFYAVTVIGGFKLLSIVNVSIAIAIILIFFNIAKSKSNFLLASALILPVILITSQRTEIRPEAFSYLFLAFESYLIYNWRTQTLNSKHKILHTTVINKFNFKSIKWIVPIQLLWINLHIYFFLGFFLIGAALIEQLIIKYKYIFKSNSIQELFKVLYVSVLISLLNPHFIKGLLYPFSILREYGYEIVENKSPFYLEEIMINYNISLFKFIFILLVISFTLLLIQRKRIAIYNVLVASFFSFLAFFAIRNLPIFALITLPIIANNIYITIPSIKREFFVKAKSISMAIIIVYSLVLILIVDDARTNHYFIKQPFGFGLADYSENSISFFRDNKLRGPIFNNYDLGSALEYWLYPDELVFVDNRPEAYTVSFFHDIYKPMQEDTSAWKLYSKQYNINSIYFSHTDGTPWALSFIASRLNDKNWTLVYFDYYSIIMLKNTEQNSETIKKHAITADGFKERITYLNKGTSFNHKLNLAQLCLLNGQSDLALNTYNELEKKLPNNMHILASKGYLLSSSQNESDVLLAQDYLQRSIDEGYKLASVYNKMGLNYWNLRDYPKAETLWKKALKLDKKNTHALYYLNQVSEPRKQEKL
ncbi:tetratricopeptide repeat protein [Patescibacteria group bacterium]|nr:tetratricopeptide repeat protein [Patescibacteria group bacterium]